MCSNKIAFNEWMCVIWIVKLTLQVMFDVSYEKKDLNPD